MTVSVSAGRNAEGFCRNLRQSDANYQNSQTILHREGEQIWL